MMIAQQLETLIKISRTLLKEKEKKFTVSTLERFENRDQQYACRV